VLAPGLIYLYASNLMFFIIYEGKKQKPVTTVKLAVFANFNYKKKCALKNKIFFSNCF
jgi:hypothetical protein